MSRRGYGFERETELFCCRLAEQDVKGDFSQRSFRTATSGAATSSKGDVRLLNVPWIRPITFECKHLNDWSSKGATFHLYVDWMKKIEEEALANKAIPMLTWAFKHARTHKGEGRVQFAIPFSEFAKLCEQASVDWKWVRDLVKYIKKKSEYFLVYHDALWEEAKDPDFVTGFVVTCDSLPQPWVIISRRHLEKILIAIREKWKTIKSDAA